MKELETQIDSMQSTSTSGEAEEEDAYTKQIRELSKLYADMSPSKAAPIMQNLTLEEMVLMLSQMKSATGLPFCKNGSENGRGCNHDA